MKLADPTLFRQQALTGGVWHNADAMLTAIDGTKAKLRPEHVCLIGVRSYEVGEAALLLRLGGEGVRYE